MFGWMFNQTKILEKSLDASWLRNQVISNNIANVDTPGFKSSKVVFEDALQSAMETGNGNGGDISSLDQLEPEVVTSQDTTMRMDGNNVDIDMEMANLAQNTIQYNALIQKISKELGRIQMVINEGKR